MSERAASKLSLVLIVVIIVIATALRTYGLDAQSLWHDELFAWYSAKLQPLAAGIRFGAAEDVHPPGYLVLLHATERLIGDSETALRLPSAIAGVVSVGFVYRLGRRWLSPAEGLGAAALTATAWFPIYYSQEARPYAILMALVLVFTDVLTSLDPRATFSRRSAVLASATWALAVSLSYLHYFGLLFVVLASAAWLIPKIGDARSRWLWLGLAVATTLAYAPWILQVIGQIERGKIWIPLPDGARVWSVYDQMANDRGVAMLGLWVAGSVVAMMARRSVNVAPRPVIWVLVAWATVPVVAALAISHAVLPVLTERNLIVIFPALALLTAAALRHIDQRLWGWPVATVAVVTVLLFDLLGPRNYYITPTKWQYREVAHHVAQYELDAAQPPLFVSGAWHPSYFDYYFTRMSATTRVGASAGTRTTVVREVARLRPEEFWVAIAAPKKARRRGRLRLAGYAKADYQRYLGWDLYRFRRGPP